jgi:beta-glucosidase-like glycosyl hydrolase/CubicO group peptidase (beta-lactamase class C family)
MVSFFLSLNCNYTIIDQIATMKKAVLLLLVFCLFSSQIDAQSRAEKRWVKKHFKVLSLDEKIAQLMVLRAHSNWDEKKIDTLSQLIKKYNVGGLCFFQGGPVREAIQTNYYQSIAKTPLLITMDAEWGVGMRLDSVEMFPRQLLMGAIASDKLMYDMGVAIAAQCKRLGIQVNYAPDIDINNNPSNPVINDRSFGQDKNRVINHGIAYMKGMQDNGVMATAKHFPGHGDVSVDSHLELPIINKSREALDSMELAPFRALIKAGIGSVMVAHLSVPAIDTTAKYATSLSPKAVNDLLKKELGFKGLSVTDAMDMKAISNYFPRGEANVRALLAGNDMLCLPGDIAQSIAKIKEAIQEGRLTEEDINVRVKKVLAAKYKYGLNVKQTIDTTNIVADLNASVGDIKDQMSAQALTYCKANNLPNLNNGLTTAYIALNLAQASLLTTTLSEQHGVKVFLVNPKDSLTLTKIKDSINQFQQVIVGIHNYSRRPANHFQIPSFILQYLNESHPANWIHLVLGNPYAVADFKNINNILFAYEDNDFVQASVLKWLQGSIKATGQLPVTVTEELKFGAGDIQIQKLNAIDSIVYDAIKKKAIPGCQVLVAKNNKVIFNKAYGTTAGEGSSPVSLDTYYDLASVTKVSATTVSIMKLVEEGKVDINKTIGDYLPWVRGSAKSTITLKDLLLHQAGLYPYIKFYESLLKKDGSFIQGLVSTSQDNTHHSFISPNKWLIDTWKDTIQNQILKSAVTTPGKYIYSDNDFIFLGRIVEQVTNMSLQDYTFNTFYGPMGMQSTGYLPLQKTNIENIAATEVDNYFRHELIRGSVHDEGASTMGGIAGHAGLFSNATDLAKLYLMLLNGGLWEGKQYLQAATINKFTAYNSDNSRRGLGFDKPEKNNATSKDPYPSLSPSPATFGHTGFTGTCVWADPETGILFVFLSNRVYPTRDNKVFSNLNLRPKIQEAIYTALK